MKDITLEIPFGFEEEKKYTAEIISHFCGIKFNVVFKNRKDYVFFLPDGSSLICKDVFFAGLGDQNNYIHEHNIPKDITVLPGKYGKKVPVIYGDGTILHDNNKTVLGADIFGSIFFMISRWEEAAVKDKDDHGRFPGEMSLAVRKNFIKRPVVDEYIELLKKLIAELDASIVFEEYNARINITCDVDSYEKFLPGKTLKMFAGHALKRFDPVLFFSDIFKYTAKLLGAKDPYYKFNRIFNIAKKFDTKPVYFILVAPEGPYNDGWFERLIKDKAVFTELAFKGTEIGLHYGYFSLLNENNIKSEKFELEKKYNRGITKGRAHFLQFDVRNSYSILEKSGIKEDWTMGYPGHSGFRCGTGRAFRPWDFNNKKPYKIKEIPLIVMDTTLATHKKMKYEAVAEEVLFYLKIVKQFNTDITLLLHNSSPSYIFNAFEDAAEEFLSGKT